MLKKIRAGHLGMNKCKARARGLLFWPGFDGSIESIIRSCSACQKYAYKQQSEPLILRPTPSMPWYRVGIDIFCFAGDAYLTVYDAHSNFHEVEKLATRTAPEVGEKTSAIFARYGISGQVCTDNGPQCVKRICLLRKTVRLRAHHFECAIPSVQRMSGKGCAGSQANLEKGYRVA